MKEIDGFMNKLMREAFDKWAMKTGYDPHHHAKHIYENAWESWQAAIAWHEQQHKHSDADECPYCEGRGMVHTDSADCIDCSGSGKRTKQSLPDILKIQGEANMFLEGNMHDPYCIHGHYMGDGQCPKCLESLSKTRVNDE